MQGDRARRAQGVATLASGEYAAYRAASSGHSADTLEPLIDVRPHASFIERHVRWATSIPIDELRGTKPVDAIDFAGKRIGVASGIIIAACIKGNEHLQSIKCARHAVT